MSQLSLQVWPSEFLLPSIDAKCLQYMACAKFCEAPVRIEPSVSPWSTSKGMPVFKLGLFMLAAFKNCANSNALRMLIIINRIAKVVFCVFVVSKIGCHFVTLCLQLYTIWLNKYNLNAIIDRWYCEKLGIAYAYYFVGKMRKRAQRFLLQRYGYHADVSQLEDKAHLRFCSSTFFQQPSSVDAFVFGCLAPLIYIPLPDNRLQVFLRSQCPNLVQFVSSIINIYMPLPEDEEYSRERQGSSSSVSPTAYPLWEKIVFGIVAATLSVAFAIGCGVIQENSSARISS
ncbi:hypothetical protein TTRE_0000061601 [Trichuris trichiura]|uniref:Metaxin glutathione S-transferase domain-containing protein n=1 Tax=Trichuris trichiura TaxID=36087 RepID=A0A077YWE1_TRITR|nr:hypothetical protein TTRE_0000061601 [Trichuris trichiura]